MRNLKKFLALVLAMVMVMSASAMVSADFTDVNGSNYIEAINDLTVKGIIKGMTETTFGPKQPVNREQMAIFMARVLTGDVENDDAWKKEAVTPFEDVANFEYQGAIQYAWANGIINGKAPTTYAPADGIKYVEALAMAIRALGLDDGKIEWPWGYLNTAVNLGLTDGITGVAIEQALTREETAQIIYNLIWATPNGAESLASKNFNIKTTDNANLFVITATPKQHHGNNYISDYTKNDKGVTYVGVQALVDGIATGAMYYIPAEELGIAADKVEDYFFYSVELINFNAETGAFGAYIMGDEPEVVTQSDVSVSNTGLGQIGGVITVGGNNYYAINSYALSELRNNIAIYDSFAMDQYVATPIWELDEKTQQIYILDIDGNRVARAIGFDAATIIVALGGDETDEETEVDIEDVIEEVLPNLYYYELGTGKNISYEQIVAKYGISFYYGIQWTTKLDKRAQDNAYQLKLYDDDRDGLYERAVYVPVFMGVYDVIGGTAKYDALVSALMGSNVSASSVTYTNTAAQVDGTVSVYTYNPQLKVVDVIDIVDPVVGTLEKFTVTSRGKVVNVTVDGSTYQMFFNKNDGVNYNWSSGSDGDVSNGEIKFATLGANIVANGNPFVAGWSIADNDKYAFLNYYKNYTGTTLDTLSTLVDRVKTGATVMYYEYNGYIIMIGELARGILGDIAVIETPREFYYDGVYYDIITNGEKVENAHITVLDGKDISGYKTYDWLFASFLDNKNYHNPGAIYFTRYGVDKGDSYEFDILLDTYDEFVADYYGNGQLFQDAIFLDTASNGYIAFNEKAACTDGENTLRTDANTVWYFIYTDEDNAMNTKIEIHTGAAYNETIVYDENTWIFADNYGAAADLIIVKDPVSTGINLEKTGLSLVYVKGLGTYETGTATEFGLVDKYGEYKGTYYKYTGVNMFDMDNGTSTTGAVLYSKDKYTAYDCFYIVDADGMIIANNGGLAAWDMSEDYGFSVVGSKATKYETQKYNIQNVVGGGSIISYHDVMAYINGEAFNTIEYYGNGTTQAKGPVAADKEVASLEGITSHWDLGLQEEIVDAYFDKNGRLVATINMADGTVKTITAEDDVTNLVVAGYEFGAVTGADALNILNKAHHVYFLDFDNDSYDDESFADHTAVFYVDYFNLGFSWAGPFEQAAN